MTIAEVFLLDYDFEISNTRRTIERLTADLAGYAPHEKSMKLGKLAMHCATMPLFGAYIFEDDAMDMAASKHPQADLTFTTPEAALARLDESNTRCRALLAAATDEQMLAPWKFSFGEHIILNESRAKCFRLLCFNHLIHHTAQLGVYLRLNNLPVPALYGPSADEQWAG